MAGFGCSLRSFVAGEPGLGRTRFGPSEFKYDLRYICPCLHHGSELRKAASRIARIICRRNWEVFREYVDTGFCGARASRPALDRLMADAAQHEFECVLVWKLDRFGRSVLHLNQQLAALTSYGVRFISTSKVWIPTGQSDARNQHPSTPQVQNVVAPRHHQNPNCRNASACGR